MGASKVGALALALALALVLVFLFAGATGCSSRSDSGGAFLGTLAAELWPPDPCGLLTAQEVSAAYGSTVDQPGAASGAIDVTGQRDCLWGNDHGLVNLRLTTDASLAASNLSHTSLQEEYEGPMNPDVVVTPIADLGVAAKVWTSFGDSSVLVLLPDALVEIGFVGGPVGLNSETAVTTLARAAVGRLPEG